MWTVYALNDGKPNPIQYGFGWRITEQGNHSLIEQSGGWQGITCAIARYPDDNLNRQGVTYSPRGHAQMGSPGRTLH